MPFSGCCARSETCPRPTPAGKAPLVVQPVSPSCRRVSEYSGSALLLTPSHTLTLLLIVQSMVMSQFQQSCGAGVASPGPAQFQPFSWALSLPRLKLCHARERLIQFYAFVFFFFSFSFSFDLCFSAPSRDCPFRLSSTTNVGLHARAHLLACLIPYTHSLSFPHVAALSSLRASALLPRPSNLTT